MYLFVVTQSFEQIIGLLSYQILLHVTAFTTVCTRIITSPDSPTSNMSMTEL